MRITDKQQTNTDNELKKYQQQANTDFHCIVIVISYGVIKIVKKLFTSSLWLCLWPIQDCIKIASYIQNSEEKPAHRGIGPANQWSRGVARAGVGMLDNKYCTKAEFKYRARNNGRSTINDRQEIASDRQRSKIVDHLDRQEPSSQKHG